MLGASLAGIAGAVPSAQAASGQEPAGAGGKVLRAVNFAQGVYYSGIFPFTDLMKNAAEDWAPNTWTDANGWLRGLPAGREAYTWVVLHLDSVHGRFAPGRYLVTSSSRATLSLYTLDASYFENVRNGVGKAEFTVKPRADGDFTKISIAVRCKNDTDSPIDVLDLTLRDARHEADERAGPFHAAWMATNDGVGLVRTMDWAATNHSPVVSATQLPSAGRRSWAKGVPYAMHARAAAALESDLWVCVPHGGENYLYTCSAATGTFTTVRGGGTPSKHSFREGQTIVFVDYSQGRKSLPEPLAYGTAYHAVNCSDASFQVSERPGGPALRLSADVDAKNYSRVSSALGIQGLSELYETIARQLLPELHPRSRVYVEYSNEVWNFSFVQSHFARQYLATLGATPKAASTGYAVGSLVAWRSFEKVLGRERVRRVLCGQSAWFENLGPALDYVDNGILDSGKSTARLADVYGIAPYVFPADGAGKSMDVNALFRANAAEWRDQEWDSAFDKHIGMLSSAVASHLAKAKARNEKLAFTSYECGQHLGGAVPADKTKEGRALQRRYLEYLDGPRGAAMYARYIDRVFASHGLRHFTHFTDAGGYSSSRHLFQWGLKRSHFDADTPRGALVRSLPKNER